MKPGQARYQEIYDPSTGKVQARVARGRASDLEAVVASARAAQPAWAALNPQRRARVLFNFKAVIEAHKEELAHLLSSEHGKVVSDAHGDVQRGLDVVEFACGAPHLLKGEFTEGAGPGIDVFSMRQQPGGVAGITPFIFPALIPPWQIVRAA